MRVYMKADIYLQINIKKNIYCNYNINNNKKKIN